MLCMVAITILMIIRPSSHNGLGLFLRAFQEDLAGNELRHLRLPGALAEGGGFVETDVAGDARCLQHIELGADIANALGTLAGGVVDVIHQVLGFGSILFFRQPGHCLARHC